MTGDLDSQILAPPASSGSFGPAGFAVPDGPSASIRGFSETTPTSIRLGGAEGLRNLRLQKAMEDAAVRIGRVRRTGGESAVNVRERSAQRVARVRATSRVLTRYADGGPSLLPAATTRVTSK